MPNSFFQFKQFKITQARSGMKVTTDACLFGAWISRQLVNAGTEPDRVLDIGTGTGLLALMIAQATRGTEIEGIDLNKEAYEEALNNFKESTWSNRLACFNQSLQSFRSPQQYDLIVCNPPYFGKNQKGLTGDRNQAIHNDHLSMEELSIGINKHLKTSGEAWILYPEWEMKAFIKWMEKIDWFPSKLITIRNKKNSPVFRIIGRFTKEQKQKMTQEILIRNEEGTYTEQFEALIADYYL